MRRQPQIPSTHKHLPLYTVYKVKSIHSPQINKISSYTVLSTFLGTHSLSSSKFSIYSACLPNVSLHLPALRETWLSLLPSLPSRIGLFSPPISLSLDLEMIMSTSSSLSFPDACPSLLPKKA